MIGRNYRPLGFLSLNLVRPNCFKSNKNEVYLMYLRPMLGLGGWCKLDEACRAQGIELNGGHIAAHDALASGKLYRRYQQIALDRGIKSFGDLAGLKKYKFNDRFTHAPFPHPATLNLKANGIFRSRSAQVTAVHESRAQHPMAAYFDTLKTVVADLEITDQELALVLQERQRLGLSLGQVRSIHAKAFASVIAKFADDGYVDNLEVLKLQRLYPCLSK